MKIAWVVETLGIFGAVRELVEVSNALIRRGHTVTLYHPAGTPCRWLPCQAQTARLDDLAHADLDVAILLGDWQGYMHQAFDAAPVTHKVLCIMGFDGTQQQADLWTGKTPAPDSMTARQVSALRRYPVLTDSTWQNRWLKANLNITCLPPCGGVNLQQFRPVEVARSHSYYLIGLTGDTRARKGLDTVQTALERLHHSGERIRVQSYWNRGLPQSELAAWYSNADVFLDAERRAGWANPPAEAMACGCAVVSTDIGAVRDFAIDGETALLVPVDDGAAMAEAALRLLRDAPLRKRLAAAGLERIKAFSYNRVVVPLEKALQEMTGAR